LSEKGHNKNDPLLSSLLTFTKRIKISTKISNKELKKKSSKKKVQRKFKKLKKSSKSSKIEKFNYLGYHFGQFLK